MTKEVAEQGSYGAKDYHDPPPAPLFDSEELTKWSFYRALIAEFIVTLLFLYITVLTVIGYKSQSEADQCAGVGILGIAWAFGGMIFVLVYCTAGISGGHINPAVTFGLFLARKMSLVRAVMYMVAYVTRTLQKWCRTDTYPDMGTRQFLGVQILVHFYPNNILFH